MTTENNTKSWVSTWNGKDWLIAILLIVILLLGICAGVYYHKFINAENQIVIWNDSAFIYKNKYNEEYAAKNMYILKAEQLQKYNNELYKEYQNLKDNPVIITKIQTITKIDSVKADTESIIYKDSLITWSWHASDSSFYKMTGTSKVKVDDLNTAITEISQLIINAKLSMNVVDNGEQLSVMAKTDNPYISFGDMSAVVIDPTTCPTLKNYFKPKKWGLGVYLGAGVNVGYDPIHNQVGINFGPSIGIAVTYNIIQW